MVKGKLPNASVVAVIFERKEKAEPGKNKINGKKKAKKKGRKK